VRLEEQGFSFVREEDSSMVRIACVLLLLLPAVCLAEEEKPKPAYIGVQIGVGKEEGIIKVIVVINNSPAEKAGLKTGDRLVRINDVKPANIASAVRVIRSLKPGKKVKLLIERDGKEKTLDIVPASAEE
jgi:S1-C subfamily serine protease